MKKLRLLLYFFQYFWQKCASKAQFLFCLLFHNRADALIFVKFCKHAAAASWTIDMVLQIFHALSLVFFKYTIVFSLPLLSSSIWFASLNKVTTGDILITATTVVCYLKLMCRSNACFHVCSNACVCLTNQFEVRNPTGKKSPSPLLSNSHDLGYCLGCAVFRIITRCFISKKINYMF